MAGNVERSIVGIRARPMVAAAMLAVLSACAGAPDGPPRNVGDLCAIYAERPDWAEAAAEAEARWGAPQELGMAIIWRESSFRHDARPPETYALGLIPTGPASSAYGYPQAIDGTWDWYRDETGAGGADRDDFADAIDFVGWYVAKTRAVTGVSDRDAFAQYLAYHEGHAGYRSGRWRGKPAVRRAAAEVAAQAERYAAQRARCAA